MRVIPFVLLAVALAGCGSAAPEAAERSAGWERLPAPPLSPRESAVALSIDGEAMFVGGSDADPCPPGADCNAPSAPPLRDGAAYDPGLRRWERIARAPVGLSFASSAALGRATYLLVPGEPGRPDAPAAFLRYRRAGDRWTRLALPPDPRRRSLVATGDEVVAYAGSDEGGALPDMVFDPSSGAWAELPDDPLPPSFDRTMAWSGRELVLFAHELVPQPGSREPSVVIAAAFDPARGTWRRLPDSEIAGGGARWFARDGRLILPGLGRDGGGVLDVEADRWLPLPDGPHGDDEFSAGVVAGREADFWGAAGWILDAVAGEWIAVPPLHDGDETVTGAAVAAAGRDMIVFGGARWGDGQHAELLDDAWMWSVP